MTKGFKASKAGIVLTIMIFLFTMLLSACGSSSKPNAAATGTPAATATETAAPSAAANTPASLPEVKLTWYFVGPWPQPEQDQVFAEVNKVIKAKINATVDFKPLAWGDYDQKMKVVIASGEPYDIAFTANWINNYSQNVGKGAFLPLDDLLAKYAPQSFANVPKSFWDATKVKGKIYGFVNQQISARTPSIGIPKDLADQYNFDINTLAGKINGFTFGNLVEPIVKKVIKDYPQKYIGMSMDQIADAFNFEPIVGFHTPGVVAYSDDSLKVVNQFETDEVKAFVATLRDWNAKGYMNSKERISSKTDDPGACKAGKCMIGMGGTYKPGNEQIGLAQNGYLSVDAPANIAHLTTSGITATMMAINRNSKNPERAMMLLELMNTDKDLYNLLNFGIKDKHYKIDADGFMVPGDDQKEYNPYVPWMFASNYLANVEKGMPKTIWEDTKKINESAIPSKLLGFTFDAEPVKAEIGKTNAVYDEYHRAIDLGVASEAKYNEFVAKLKAAGSDKIIAEMQKQIDAWKITK
ncbi:ABC transporter substrate-binding protein [Paenibacillus prosopidis]|uniref:Putative aldouronate transport system substrate-binding protein n=1 Tax=Paenibacillus prosopidis TaxID=630520 RepID=A0A368W122_9BACL|nr:ABC transporter substrate-binding protein [Paenibacillus prosopidis]RCW48522.1 putative aldouronate transport system substrate-binding protein [Paenibacillus prosopidis]